MHLPRNYSFQVHASEMPGITQLLLVRVEGPGVVQWPSIYEEHQARAPVRCCRSPDAGRAATPCYSAGPVSKRLGIVERCEDVSIYGHCCLSC